MSRRSSIHRGLMAGLLALLPLFATAQSRGDLLLEGGPPQGLTDIPTVTPSLPTSAAAAKATAPMVGVMKPGVGAPTMLQVPPVGELPVDPAHAHRPVVFGSQM